jgi:hypothetical protein
MFTSLTCIKHTVNSAAPQPKRFYRPLIRICPWEGAATSDSEIFEDAKVGTCSGSSTLKLTFFSPLCGFRRHIPRLPSSQASRFTYKTLCRSLRSYSSHYFQLSSLWFLLKVFSHCARRPGPLGLCLQLVLARKQLREGMRGPSQASRFPQSTTNPT